MMEQMAVARAQLRPAAGTRGGLREALARRPLVHAAMFAILAFYLATRASMVARLPYIGDEGWHGTFVVQVAHSLSKLWVSLTIAKEPLVIWIAALFTKVGFEPMVALRLVSLLGGLAAVIVAGLFARHVGGRGAGLAAMAIGAALPFWLVLDTLGLMDALIAAEVAVALYLQVRLAERPGVKTALGLGLVLAAAVLTKESGKSAVALLPLSLLVFDWTSPGVRERLARWMGCAALAVGLAGLAYLWMRSSSLWGEAEDLRKVPIQYPVRPLSAALDDPITALKNSVPEYRADLVWYFTIPLLLAAAGGWVLLLRERLRLALLLTIWIVVPLTAALLLPYSPYARHIMFLTPTLVVLAGIGLARGVAFAAERWGRRRGGPAAIAAGVALAFTPALVLDARILADPAGAHYPGADTYQYVRGPSGGAIWPGVADEIRKRTGGRPAVVMKSAAVTFVLEFLLDDPKLTFVYGDDPRAKRAKLIVQDTLPFPDPAGQPLLDSGRFRLVRTFHRPRDGYIVRLYERKS
jgi:4-amino-4-deoxy-L-arabinose transferase-like glycosyltransferase